MFKNALLALTFVFPFLSHAYLKQRNFYQIDQGGIETFVHWNPSQRVRLHIHEFSGTLNDSNLTYQDLLPAISFGIKEWTEGLLGNRRLNLRLNLEEGRPYATQNSCETTATGTPDSKNNIVFSSKMNPRCGSPIARGEGIIGVTRVLYEVTSGQIVEADMQFNDLDYDFTLTGLNQLNRNERVVNLKDVFAHEFGHFLGLDHSNQRDSTMLFSVSDALSTTSTDDELGVMSLYGAQGEGLPLSGFKGSVMNHNSKAVFGATVYLIEKESLAVVSSLVTDLNGVFQACHLPEGNYVSFVDRFRPNSRGVKVHSYYAGDRQGDPTRDSSGKCHNPACRVMNNSIQPQWFSGEADNVLEEFSVHGNMRNRYLNLKLQQRVASVLQNENELGSLQENRVLAQHMSDRPLPVSGQAHLASHSFRVDLLGGETYRFNSLSLGLNTRLALQLSLNNNSDQDVTEELCQSQEVKVSEGLDPKLTCHIPLEGTGVYRLHVEGRVLPCDEIPGNGRGMMCQDTQSSSASHYLLQYINVNRESDFSSAGVLESRLAVSNVYNLLPACGRFKNDTTRTKKNKRGGCAALIPLGGGSDDFWWPLLFSFLSLPLLWLLLFHLTRGVLRFIRKLV